MQRSGLNIRVLLMLGIIGFSVLKYFFTTSINPVTGQKQHVSMSPEQEIAMGLQSAPQMAAQFGGEYNDPKVQNAIKAIGSKLVKSTQAANSPYRFEFHVLADPETINAFALPGGQIFITVGLLKRLENEHEIAGVFQTFEQTNSDKNLSPGQSKSINRFGVCQNVEFKSVG